MTGELEVAITAAREAGNLIMERFGEAHTVRHKGPADLVTEVDREAENLIVGVLTEAFPDYHVVGEEGGGQPVPGKPCWLVDPIDGTVNYAHGYPFFAVSIALEKGSQVMLGAVYNPNSGELFTAERGRGASVNGRAIRVSRTPSLSESLLASGFPHHTWTSQADNGREWHRLLKRVVSLRCDGAASLDLCNVAIGRIDGYWELYLSAWDMAAGVLIVHEAGGIITQVNGEPFAPYERSVVASNGLFHDDILAALNET